MSAQGQGSFAGSPRIRPVPPPGPPFDPNSADNGLSVDPGSGRIVLGNDIGGVAATLLNFREIPMAGFEIRFTGVNQFSGIADIGLFVDALLGTHQAQIVANASGAGVTILSNPGAGGSNPFVSLNYGTPGNTANLENDPTVGFVVRFPNPFGNYFLRLDPPNSIYQIGDLIGNGNNNRLSIDDATEQTTVSNATGQFLLLDGINLLFRIGDIGASGNGWKLEIDDPADLATIGNSAGIFLNLDKNADSYALGDASNAFGGTVLLVNDGIQQVIAAAQNGLRIDNDAAFLIHTGTSLTDGSGALAATLGNSPVLGDPTKWIAIDDNGVTRHIPAW